MITFRNSCLLPPVFRRFGLLYPQAEIRVFCAQSTALVPLVEAGEIDLAVVTRSKGVGGRLIRREPMVWIAARDGAALEKRPLLVALFEPGSEARSVALAALSQSNLPFRTTYESFSLAGLLTIVEARLAVAAVSHLSAPAHLILAPDSGGLKPPAGLDIALIRDPAVNQVLCDAVEELVMQVP